MLFLIRPAGAQKAIHHVLFYSEPVLLFADALPELFSPLLGLFPPFVLVPLVPFEPLLPFPFVPVPLFAGLPFPLEVPVPELFPGLLLLSLLPFPLFSEPVPFEFPLFVPLSEPVLSLFSPD